MKQIPKNRTPLVFEKRSFIYRNYSNVSMQGSYQSGNTASRPISEVKHSWVTKVLAWETSLEPVMILRFCLFQETYRFFVHQSRGGG